MPRLGSHVRVQECRAGVAEPRQTTGEQLWQEHRRQEEGAVRSILLQRRQRWCASCLWKESSNAWNALGHLGGRVRPWHGDRSQHIRGRRC